MLFSLHTHSVWEIICDAVRCLADKILSVKILCAKIFYQMNTCY